MDVLCNLLVFPLLLLLLLLPLLLPLPLLLLLLLTASSTTTDTTNTTTTTTTNVCYSLFRCQAGYHVHQPPSVEHIMRQVIKNLHSVGHCDSIQSLSILYISVSHLSLRCLVTTKGHCTGRGVGVSKLKANRRTK
jgi:hypothetical protein